MPLSKCNVAYDTLMTVFLNICEENKRSGLLFVASYAVTL